MVGVGRGIVRAFAAALSVALGACTIFPGYKSPSLDIPAAWRDARTTSRCRLRRLSIVGVRRKTRCTICGHKGATAFCRDALRARDYAINAWLGLMVFRRIDVEL